MRREWMAFALIGAAILVTLLTEYGVIPDPEPDIGAGGPPEFILGILFAIIAFALPRAKPVIGLDRPVRIWRRVVALVIDWYVAGFGILAVIGLSGLAFSSVALMPGAQVSLSPWSNAALVLAGLSAFFCYFWLHPKFGRATLGQYVMGYRIERDPDPNVPPHHFVRTWVAAVAACSGHLWIWFVNDKNTPPGTYWWDRVGQTRAVFVGPY